MPESNSSPLPSGSKAVRTICGSIHTARPLTAKVPGILRGLNTNAPYVRLMSAGHSTWLNITWLSRTLTMPAGFQ